MQEIYTNQDSLQTDAQRAGILRWMAVFSAVLLVGIGLSFWRRIEPLTMGLTILLGGGLVFLWDLKLRPVSVYRRFLREMETGLSREAEGVAVLFETEPSYREGLQSWRLLLNVDEKGNPEGERQFFVDANKPRPAIETGHRVKIRTHGSEVLAWQDLGEAQHG